MEYPTDPQVGIVWETREVLSLIGIIIFGTSAWYYGRKFDEDGSLAYQTVLDTMNGVDYNAVDDNGHPLRKFVTNADGSRDAISVCTEDNRREDIIIIPTDALQRALPIPHGCIIGIFLWTISFLFLPGEGTALPYTGWNLFCVCLLPIMTILFITRIRTSTLERNLQDKKKTLSLIFLLSIILIIASIVDPEIEAPWYFAVFGAILLMLSYSIMGRSRKMGISWDMEGRPTCDVPSQNLGALTLILGLYLFWVGTNSILLDEYVRRYIVIHTGYRSWFVFWFAFVHIIPSSMALDFAFDQGSEPAPLLAVGELYKLDGRTLREVVENLPFCSKSGLLGDALETPWPLLSGWILFGLCSFMPFGNGVTFQEFMTCLICCTTGIIYTFRLLPAYWNREATFRTSTFAYYSSMGLLAITIGVGGQWVPSIMGILLILLGQHVELFEKKKGKHWIQHGEENPRPTVAYGVGHPIYVLGWLFLCYAMSVPMN